MKQRLQIQFHNKNIDASAIEKQAKEDLKAKGVKMTTVDTLEVYYKPEDCSIYYVATTKTGDVIGNEEPLYME